MSPRPGRCGDDDISSCSDVVGANVDGDLVGVAVGRSEGTNVGRLVALAGALVLVGEPGAITVGLVVIGCSVGLKVGRALVLVLVVGAGGSVPMNDFSSLLPRTAKTHTSATRRPTRSKKMKPNAAVLGLLILRRRSLLAPHSDPGASDVCDGEHVLLHVSSIVICKVKHRNSTAVLFFSYGGLGRRQIATSPTYPPAGRPAQPSKQRAIVQLKAKTEVRQSRRATRGCLHVGAMQIGDFQFSTEFHRSSADYARDYFKCLPDLSRTSALLHDGAAHRPRRFPWCLPSHLL